MPLEGGLGRGEVCLRTGPTFIVRPHIYDTRPNSDQVARVCSILNSVMSWSSSLAPADTIGRVAGRVKRRTRTRQGGWRSSGMARLSVALAVLLVAFTVLVEAALDQVC